MCKGVYPGDEQRIGALLRDEMHIDAAVKLTRLDSMTNRTYRADLSDGRAWVIRIPGDGTQEMIDRAAERTSTIEANRLGLDAPLLYFGANGEKVTACIPDAVTMSPETMRSPERIAQVAEMLRTLHSGSTDTDVVFDVFALAELYESVAAQYGVQLFPDFPAAKDAVLRIRREQTENGRASTVFCHNDPIYANWLLDRNGRMYLIDWEYAGMNDPMWDLADLSVESGFSASEDDMLLTAYLRGQPDKLSRQCFLANKVYVDYLWSLWAKAREPFEGDWVQAYGSMRFARMQNLIRAYRENG